MIKKIAVISFVVCLLFLTTPGLVQAGNGLAVLTSSVEMDFPLKLSFDISAEGNVDITDIRLHYQVERIGFAEVTSEVYIAFEPATTVAEHWEWDMRRTGGLPPGTSVVYWWTLTDAVGNTVKTDQARIPIEDSRYNWRSLTQGNVTLYWYEGDDSFAGELMAVIQQAQARLEQDTGAELEKPVKMYIYANSRDLQGSMVFPQEWTGGVTFTRYGIIAIGIGPSDLEWGSRAIAHEMTHLIINQVTLNPYNYLPTWLNEGLAVKSEGELEPSFENSLHNAIDSGELLTVKSLSSPFSAFAEESYLAYAESYSVVKYLIDNYGQDKMFQLLNIFQQGSGYDEALEKVYGFDMGGLDAEWRESISAAVPAPVSGKGIHPAITGLLAGPGTVLVLGASLFAESRDWRRAR